MLLVSKWI